MSASSDVLALFDDKAETWGEKYAPGGPLHGRLARFRRALERLEPRPGEVLDLGCGAGDLANHLSVFGFTLTAADASPRMLDVARRRFPASPVRWEPLAPDWRRLPFEAGRFDAVIASSVLEYVPDVAAVLGEVARVLRPGGALLATVPNPDHPLRVAESLAFASVRLPGLRGVAEGVGRARRFLRYLEASKNRFSLVEWEERLRTAGLLPEPPELEGPLSLLVARRRAPVENVPEWRPA